MVLVLIFIHGEKGHILDKQSKVAISFDTFYTVYLNLMVVHGIIKYNSDYFW